MFDKKDIEDLQYQAAKIGGIFFLFLVFGVIFGYYFVSLTTFIIFDNDLLYIEIIVSSFVLPASTVLIMGDIDKEKYNPKIERIKFQGIFIGSLLLISCFLKEANIEISSNWILFIFVLIIIYVFIHKKIIINYIYSKKEEVNEGK